MTNPNDSLSNTAGGNDPRKKPADASSGAPQSDKSRADAWNAGGSRSPGSLPEQMAPVERCETKGDASCDKEHPHSATTKSIPSGAKAPTAGDPAPATGQGVRQTKGDGGRSSQAGEPTSGAPKGGGKGPSPATPPSGKREATRPGDPKPIGTTDPVRPTTSAAIDSSPVSEASFGDAGGDAAN